MLHKGAATELEKQELAPVIGGNWSSITFQSAAPKSGDLSTSPSDHFRPGTLGFSDHGIQPRATRPKPSADQEAAQQDVTRSMATSVNIPPPISAVEIVQDYQALYAATSWEPPSAVSDFACLLAKRVVRTEANPTFNSAKSGPEWESWKPAVDAEIKLLAKS